MAKLDYRGARGSNTGDDFHELWALRQALTLLDQDTELTAITVEGLTAEDEKGAPQDTWDGVDCVFYFGGEDDASPERIVIEQLKYSAADPGKPWTVSRLTHGTNKKQDNSVLRRLAQAFMGLRAKHPELAAKGNLVVRLVSNQPVDPSVVEALSDKSKCTPSSIKCHSDRTALLAASGLQDEDFVLFVQAVDLSQCGRESRFALEEQVLLTVAEWIDDDSRTSVNDLLRFVRQKMMPEAKGELITRYSILVRLGFSDSRALFPCPSAIEKTERPVPRRVPQNAVERMLRGDQRICLHGEAGCGKTTALQEIEALLPQGSVVVVFDCYGGGRYLDSDAYRHRPRDAFLQLSNDLARQLRVPLLVNQSATLDYPRVFKKRLDRAAEVVAATASDALLVVAVDAADNSIIAASTQPSPDNRSFVHDFVALGELPGNVRLIVTSRTGRLPSLNLPCSFAQLGITGFTLDETAAHVRELWKDAPDTWVDDFHHLSQGNPRVQRYALDYAGAEIPRALDCLRPNGKELDQIFREQLNYARHKVGCDHDIQAFCSGLVALPRPVPVSDLAAVTNLSEAHIRDLCADLAPGIRLTEGTVGFADEDFEHFVRAEAETQLGLIQARAADHFLNRHRSDAYAAAHVATALFAVNRRQEIIDLIARYEPTAISDPILRREAQLQRLRIAMKVCREAGNNADAMMTLLIGAEALKTNEAIRQILVKNPDLAASFARDASNKMILRDPGEVENHGQLLFHLMAADARTGNRISVREEHRQAGAWRQRRANCFEDQKRKLPNSPPHGWPIDVSDIAAETEAVLRTSGPQQALNSVLRWHPRFVALQVASLLSSKLITSGEAVLIEHSLAEAKIAPAWQLFLLTPLALAGKKVDLSRVESSLTSLQRRRLIRLDALKGTGSESAATAEYLDMILTACEVVIARGGNCTRVAPVLEQLADKEVRRYDRLFTFQVPLIDLSLRAFALLECQAGRNMTLDTYLIDPPTPPEDLPPEKAEQARRSDGEKREELRAFIGPLIETYDVRAQALMKSIAPLEVEARLREAINRYHQENYRFATHYRAEDMRTRAALSITRLMALPDIDRAILLESSKALLGPHMNTSAEIQVFANLALDRSLHGQIIDAVAARAKTVRETKTSAEDKISALVELSRLLLPISHADAESLFNEAVDVAGEVNIDAIYEIALFAPFGERAIGSMGIEERRAVARDLAIVVSNAGVRFAGDERFSWEKAAQSITVIDVNLALAATARWEDSNIVDHATFLPTVLETALSQRRMTPVQVAALSPLFDRLSEDLVSRIIDEAIGQKEGNLEAKELAEHLAHEELLRFGKGIRQRVSSRLASLAAGDSAGFWMDRLMRTTSFLETTGPVLVPKKTERFGEDSSEGKKADLLASFNWTAHRFVSADEIDSVVKIISTTANESDTFISAPIILDHIRDVVEVRDRVLHLEALSCGEFQNVLDYDLAQAVAKCVDSWYTAPSIIHWCRERLIQVVIEHLPRFSRWIIHGESPLPTLLARSGVAGHQICAALLEAMERYVDVLDAPTVYALVGLVGQYCTPDDAVQIITRYARRLVQRIPVREQDYWDINDVPAIVTDSIARFLYALMGDVDVRVRWRAAHALRCLARLGDTGTINRIIELYNRTSEPSYRRPDAPFYWLAARLWLMITLDRVAAETPVAVRLHGLQLLEIACDDTFPHILVRAFAKSAVYRLVESGDLALSVAQRDALERANISPVQRKKARRSRRGFDRYHYRGRAGRRFEFDIMDTLPCWYSGALEAFADVGTEDFLDTAERWIVNRWGVQSNPWQWDDEPRKGRLSDRSGASMDHSHGSRPVLERFHTYLEWHAMWCTIGELMQSRALAKIGDDDFYTFEHHLRRNTLTVPPLWLADLHGPKPLDSSLWFAPQGDIDTWVEKVDGDEFLSELGLISKTGVLAIGSDHETRSREFMSSVRVRTALVSPETASALVRALQTIDDSNDYRIPWAEDELEVGDSPYKLVGWLARSGAESGIDAGDLFRYEVRVIECVPSAKTAVDLGLKFVHDGQARWINAELHDTVFLYETWGDNRSDEREERLRYEEAVRSDGWRLQISSEALKILLNKMGLDLIVKIEITRRNKGYDYYSGHDEEKAKEIQFDRVLLLRRNGTVEGVEGRLGAWTAPSA